MTPPSDIKAIVERLSEAQKHAVCGMFAWQSEVEAEAGERALAAMGLCDRHGYLTDLGYAVRDALNGGGE